MILRLHTSFKAYPGQFWLMFVGMFLSTIGISMIWPFLMIYVSKKLDAPLTVAASLLTLNSTIGLITSLLGGPLLDRVGRKWIMVFSLFSNGAAYIFMGHANLYVHFAILLGITGGVNPLYRSGADAMMVDLVPENRRADAYSLMRMSNNLGVSIGPLIGGFVASSSYTIAFYSAAAGMILYSLLMALFARETLPGTAASATSVRPVREQFGGYPIILRDRQFMGFVGTFTLVSICAILMWTIMPVYANQNFNVPENVYKWIPATNAIIVVLLQQFVTQFTKHRPPLIILAIGSFFYAIAVGSVSLAAGFWGFWLAMVVMTLGELILVPTSSVYAAHLAPADKRGRYMSLYGLSWPIGAGVGPMFGGILNDSFGPKFTWLGGMIAGLIGVVIFTVMGTKPSKRNLTNSPSIEADERSIS